MIERLPIAGCGFLLAVLWFDLIFDTLALAAAPGPIDDETLSRIAAYYARVTTEAHPMGRVVGLVMIATLAALGLQLWAGSRAPSAAGKPSKGIHDRPSQPTGTGGATSGASTL